MVSRFVDSGEHSIIASEAHSLVPATSGPALRAAEAAVIPAPPTTMRTRTAGPAASVVTHPALAAELSKSSDFLEQKLAAVEASSMHSPGAMDLRDRLFAGISETSSADQDEDGAEVVIEPDGRIRVHPRRRPGYLRYGGTLEPSIFGPGLEADQSAGEREARAAKDLLLLRLLRPRTRQTRNDRASVLESFLEEEISKLLVGESTTDGAGRHSLAELETGSRADTDSSSAADSYAKSRVLASPAGYFVAFIVGFGGILLIAMLCCVIRAAYVKRQKALLKKLLSEKLGEAGVEKPEEANLATPAIYEVIDSQEHAVPASEDTGAETEWIDVRVDLQVPPEEEQLMNVARLDTLSKTGEPADVKEGDDFKQFPDEPKKQRRKSAAVSLWGEDKSDERDSKDKRKIQKKPNRLTLSGSVEKRTTRRGKELKKVLSSRRTMRRVG